MKRLFPSLYRILLGVILGCFILGQFGRIEAGIGRALYVQDIFISIFLVLFCIDHGVAFLKRSLSHKPSHILILFDMWIIFTNIVHFHDNLWQMLTSTLYLARFNVILFFGMALYSLIGRNIITRLQVRTGVMIAIMGIAVAGLLQYVAFPDTRSLVYLGWDDHLFRLISTIFDPGFTGIIIAIGILLVMNQLWVSHRFSLASTASFFILLLSLLLTYSRASYLAFFMGVLYLAWRQKAVSILSILLLFAIGIIFLPRPGGEGVKLLRTASSNARIESVESAVAGVGLQRLVIGEGWYAKRAQMPTQSYGGVTVANHSSAPENSYVFVFASLGVVGIALWGRLLFESVKAVGWNTEVVLSLLAIGVHSLFSNTFFHPFILLLLVTIMAGNAPQVPESSPRKQH